MRGAEQKITSILETVGIAEPLQNRQHAQSPNAVNTREKGKDGGRVR